jgi:hypothetical protein
VPPPQRSLQQSELMRWRRRRRQRGGGDAVAAASSIFEVVHVHELLYFSRIMSWEYAKNQCQQLECKNNITGMSAQACSTFEINVCK